MIEALASLWSDDGQFSPRITVILPHGAQVLLLDQGKVLQREMDSKYLASVCLDGFVQAVQIGFPTNLQNLYIRMVLGAIRMHPDLVECVKV